MNELIYLVEAEARRPVFCALRSVGHSEFYEAHATEHRPELKFVIADYLDYSGETIIEYEGTLYRVIRTYRTGHELEITAGRASAEEVALYGHRNK
jgi:hypothetical protein